MVNRKIPIFHTLSSAFGFVAHRIPLFLNALFLPILLLIVLNFLFFGGLDQFVSPMFWVRDVLSLLIFAWMMNVCCRIVITETAGSSVWTMRETWSAIWLLCLSFVITLCAALPSLLVYTLASTVDPFLGMTSALLTFLLLHLYLFARFVLVFPATAMGDKMGFREAWEISEGNGWRLVILFALIPTLYALSAAGLAMLVPGRLFLGVLAMLGLFFLLVGVVAVALAYKQLK